MSRGCEFYADALIEHAAGRLDEERAARVDAHVADCAACADTLRVITALKASPAPVPVQLEARIRAAVRDVAGVGATEAPTPVPVASAARPSVSGHRRWVRWRPLTLPLAAAAAMAGLWIGVGMPGIGTTDPLGTAVAVLDDDEPYGAWPADGLIVAGDPLWSELSVEELEYLLQEMES